MTSGDSGDGGKNDDQVAAATSDDPAPTGVATDPTTEATTEATAEETKEPRRHNRGDERKVIRITDLRAVRECLLDAGRTLDGKGKPNRVPKVVKRGKHKWTLYLDRKSGQRYLAIGDGCKWVRVAPDKPRAEH